MQKITCHLPCGSHSLTRKWMEHQPGQKEILATYLAVGAISAFASYYAQKAYLITGATCFALSYALKKEPRAEYIPGDPFQLSPVADDQSSFIDGTPMPIRIMNFIVLSSFIGKCLRESWVKPTTPQSKAWTPYLCKAPFHFIALWQAGQALIEVSGKAGRKIPYAINKDPNRVEVITTAVAILAISGTITYIAPGLNLLFGVAALGSLYQVIVGTASQKSDFEELLKLGGTSIKLAMLISIGGTLGKLVRSKFGHANYTPPHCWLTTLCLLPLRAFAVGLLAGMALFKGHEQDLLDWIDLRFPSLDEQAAAYMKIFEQVFEESQELKKMTLSGLKTSIPEKQKDLEKDLEEFQELEQLRNINALPPERLPEHQERANKASIASFKFSVSKIVIQLCESKNQSVLQSVDEVTSYFKAFQAFYNKVTGREVLDYVPVKFKDDSFKDEVPETKVAILERMAILHPPGREGRDWNEEQAAYLLLADLENKKDQRDNYLELSRWFHTDKDDSPEAGDIMRALTKAQKTLGLK